MFYLKAWHSIVIYRAGHHCLTFNNKFEGVGNMDWYCDEVPNAVALFHSVCNNSSAVKTLVALANMYAALYGDFIYSCLNLE
jgi:hypothetical protein